MNSRRSFSKYLVATRDDSTKLLKNMLRFQFRSDGPEHLKVGHHSLQDVLHHRLAVGDAEQRDVAQPVEVAEVLQLELRLPAGERAHPGHGVHKVLHARRRHLPGVHGEQSQADAALQAEYFGGGQGAEEVV